LARGAGAMWMCGGGVAYSSSLAPPGGRFRPGPKHGEDALSAWRHGKPIGHGERWHAGQPLQGLHARGARARERRAHRDGRERLWRGGGCRGEADLLCTSPQRRLARLAFRAAARARPGNGIEQLSGAHAPHVRELHSRPARRTAAPRQGDRAGDRGGVCAAVAGATTHLPGCVRLPDVCPSRGAAQPRSLHARPRRSPHRRGVPLHRVALPTLAVRPALHTRLLSTGATGVGGRAVGTQGDLGGGESWRNRPDGKRGEEDGPLGEAGGRVRWLEPRPTRAGGGWRAQRHARAARARGLADARRGQKRGWQSAGERGGTAARRRG
jgi:hypothetical protein